MHTSRASLTALALSLLCVLALLPVNTTVLNAQTGCTSSNTPQQGNPTHAWPQNARVSANFSGFTQTECDCLKLVLNSYFFDSGSSAPARASASSRPSTAPRW